jgi:MSHA biogenesis protein MshN
MMCAIAWVGWVAYQLQPREVATESAYKAAEDARRAQGTITAPPASPEPLAKAPAPRVEAKKPAAERPKPPAEVSPAAAPEPAAEPTQARAETARPAAPLETFKLALSIDTPILRREEPRIVPVDGQEARPRDAPPAEPAAAGKAVPAAGKARLEKRDKVREPSDQAEADYRRAVGLLGQGRVSEAEQALTVALALYPAYEPARQALVALLIDQRRFDDAQRALHEGLKLNPTQPQFAAVLARIHAERGDFPAALEVLKPIQASAQDDAEFNYLLGVILQRLSKHEEAADAYRATLRAVPESGTSWVGLGISLEALQHRPEAADAFRRAIATGTLAAEVKTYAQQRVRQLQ